jgi:hypothetical protein
MENYMNYKGRSAPFTKLAIVNLLSPCELVKLVWFEITLKLTLFVQIYNISHMLENLEDFESTKIERKLKFNPYDMLFVGSSIFDIKFKIVNDEKY